eukprot:s1738_g2.t1
MARRTARRNGWFVVATTLATLSVSFVPGALPGSRQNQRGNRSGNAALPWDAEGNAKAERAWASLARAYPEAARSGKFLDSDCSKGTIIGRYERLGGVLGPDVALSMVEKEPVLLLGDTSVQERSFQYLTSLEEESQKGLALEAVQKNPRLLTIPEFEYERTKPSLDSLNTAATAIDFLRPLGEVGLAVAIFGSFVALLLVLRPLIYGVGGGQSLLGSITGSLPSIPKPSEIAESYGINLASLVALIPIYQVISAFRRQLN